VEQALEPPDELGLGDADLGVGGDALHRRGQRGELLLQVGREHVLELADRSLVDLAEPDPPGLVERRLAGVLEQLSDHRRDPQELRGLRDRLVLGFRATTGAPSGAVAAGTWGGSGVEAGSIALESNNAGRKPPSVISPA
jgi:hypothetical protein